MGGLNSSVITGKCSGCAAYRGKLEEARVKLAAVRLAAIKTHSDGWTDCMLCGTTWRTDVEQEYHTDCPLDTKGAE